MTEERTYDSSAFHGYHVQSGMQVKDPSEPVREVVTIRPKIVCLCGSTRFFARYQEANYQLTMDGIIVLSVGFYPHAQKEAHNQEIACSPEQKKMLDRLHLAKIDLADAIHVLNVDGYIGASTLTEIMYAVIKGKEITFYEPEKAPDLELMKAILKETHDIQR